MKEEVPARFSFHQTFLVKEGRSWKVIVNIYYDPDPLNKGPSTFLNDGIPHHESS